MTSRAPDRAGTARARPHKGPIREEGRGASGRGFHRALAASRGAAGLTQADLACRLGTTQSAIARLESGAVTPTVETLCRLAAVLGVRFEVTPRGGLTVRPATRRRLTLGALRRRRDELLKIAAAHGARHVRVFGSVARGNARADSDVDFLIELEPGRKVVDLSGLILDLQEALGRKIHVVEAQEESARAKRIHREAVPL